MSRFFVEEKNIQENCIMIDDKEDVKHLSRVLRHKTGDIVEISDGTHFEYEMRITAISEDKVTGEIVSKRTFSREPSLKVTLYQAIPKQAKMETIVQKSVELGVSQIIPVFTHRTVVTDRGNLARKQQRWQKVADEAVKQCRRGKIPKVDMPKDLAWVLSHMAENQLNLFFYEEEKTVTVKEALRGLSLEIKPETVGILIGPEGGFSDQEAESIVKAGGISVSMGKTILRVETASAAALSMVMYELEL